MLELDPDAESFQEGPTLSNDIWKKFELIPTPPRSPLRDADLDMIYPVKVAHLDLELSLAPSIELPRLLEDDIRLSFEPIDLDSQDDFPGCEPWTCTHGLERGSCTSCTQLALAGTELRHDCMWVGTCTAHAHHYHHPRVHRDSHVADLLSSSTSSATSSATSMEEEETAEMTLMEDIHSADDDDDDSSGHMVDDSGLAAQHHVARPDTPSESSETDTDEDNDHLLDDEDDDEDDDFGVSHEEEVYTTEVPKSSSVHVDHSYHCLKIPSSPPSPSRQYSRSSLLHTPSDSEDEIDVVSVGSPGSGSGASSSSRSTSKRHGDATFITTTTTAEGGMKKIVRVRTSSLPAKPSRRARKQLQKAMAAGVKRRANGSETSQHRSCSSSSSSSVQQRKAGGGAQQQQPKRLQRNLVQRKRRSPKSDSDDPEKRHLHNSLERMRRVDLRNAFEELRTLVPELCDRDKAPKVEILKKASDYCHSVVVRERNLMQEVERQKRYHSELRKRLLSLQRQLR